MCQRWLGESGFENFLADMGERPSPKHSIDRIDNDRGYEPGNCRWATRTEQNTNKRPSSLKTPTEVEEEICGLMARGVAVKSIARMFGINKNRPRIIWNRRRPGQKRLRADGRSQ